MRKLLILILFLLYGCSTYPIGIRESKKGCIHTCKAASPTGVWYASGDSACICNEQGLENVLHYHGGGDFSEKHTK